VATVNQYLCSEVSKQAAVDIALVDGGEAEYSSLMLSRYCRLFVLTAFAVAIVFVSAMPARGERRSDVFVVGEIGRSAVALDGLWAFHLGDNAAWAVPDFDDSQWDEIAADRPWDQQGHWGYDGFAWYRRSIQFAAGPDVAQDVAVLIPDVGDAYEVYWNGVLIGRDGAFPPHAVWYADSSVVVSPGPARSGVLAIRVWRAPFLSIGLNDLGGLRAAPLVGHAREIAALRTAGYNAGFRFDVSYFILCPLYLLAALLGFLPWLGDRSKSAYLWMSCFSIAMLAMLFASTPIALSATVPLLLAINRVGIGVRDIALLYMLLWLLDLREIRGLRRITDAVASLMLVVVSLYAFLLLVGWPSSWRGRRRWWRAFCRFFMPFLECCRWRLSGLRWPATSGLI